MLQHSIITEFKRSLASHNLTDEFSLQSHVTIKINSRSGEIEFVKVSDGVDDRKKELLRLAIGQCSGRVTCPKELYDDFGEYLTLDFSLAMKS